MECAITTRMGFIWWRFASLILRSSLDYETNTSHTRRFPDSSFPDSLHKTKKIQQHTSRKPSLLRLIITIPILLFKIHCKRESTLSINCAFDHLYNVRMITCPTLFSALTLIESFLAATSSSLSITFPASRLNPLFFATML